MPVSSAYFTTPSSRRLNHWMPAIFTTVAIDVSCAPAVVAIKAKAELASAAPASALVDSFMDG